MTVSALNESEDDDELTVPPQRPRPPVVTFLHHKVLLLIAKEGCLTADEVYEALFPKSADRPIRVVHSAMGLLRRQRLIHCVHTDGQVSYTTTDAGKAEAKAIQDAVDDGPRLKKLYEVDGVSVHALAQLEGVGYATMYRYLELLGANIRRRPRRRVTSARKADRQPPVSASDQAVIDLFRARRQLVIRDIAAKIDLPPLAASGVMKRLTDLGLATKAVHGSMGYYKLTRAGIERARQLMAAGVVSAKKPPA